MRAAKAVWKRLLKAVVVRKFYSRVDGALFVGDNNRAYHLHYGLPDERLFPGAYPIGRSDYSRPCPTANGRDGGSGRDYETDRRMW